MPDINITNEQRENLLVGALEGGSNDWYWIADNGDAIIQKYNLEGRLAISTALWKAIQAGETIPIHDLMDTSTKLGEINLQSIKDGEELMFKNYNECFMQVINETDDAATADVWFQLCVLKSVIYG
jgi:hypothetical protein